MNTKIWSVISIIIALIGIIAPIGYNYYKEQNNLELNVLSEISLLKDDPIFDDLNILYKNKNIKDLYKYQMLIINSGNIPIDKKDIKIYPKLIFNNTAEILNVTISKLSPSNIMLNKVIKRNEVSFEFELLNPGDYIKFNIYLTGEKIGLPTANSRIKNIKNIKVNNKINQAIESNNNFGILEYIVLIFGIILLILSLMSTKAKKQHNRSRRYIKNYPDFTDNLNDEFDLERFVNYYLSFISNEKKEQLYEIIKNKNLNFYEKKRRFTKIALKLINEIAGEDIVFYFSGIGLLVALIYLTPIIF